MTTRQLRRRIDMDFANISCNERKKMLLNINKKTRTEILHLFRTDRARSISTIYITENTEEFSRHTERTEGKQKGRQRWG